MNTNFLNTPFTLPCGVIIKNRLVKSAMTERVSNKKLEPNEKHHRLYKLWADTGLGLCITGNIAIDHIHRESAGNVYIEDERILPKLKEWATIAKSNNTQVWVQLSHAGRQTLKFLTTRPLSSSDVQLHKMGLFGKPKAMKEHQIETVIKNFVNAARICKKAGFTGIQFHAAHGYLLSQFLSPLTNKRTDKWGGKLENRSRLLMTIIDETRKILGDSFPISVKLNSSDFQRGGFTEEESLQVIKMLNGKLDLLEISGGTYEKTIMFGADGKDLEIKESTRLREAYFIEFSKKVRSICDIPLLITGGFRSFQFCNKALQGKELDFIGMARPFITDIDKIASFIHGKIDKLNNIIVKTGIKTIDDAAEAGYYARQLIRIAEGKRLDEKTRAFKSSFFVIKHELKKALIRRFL